MAYLYTSDKNLSFHQYSISCFLSFINAKSEDLGTLGTKPVRYTK